MPLNFNDKVKRMGKGMIGRETGQKEELAFLPLPIIPMRTPFGAVKRAHCAILAQGAEFVQVMMTTFFATRNPCKH
jgi:hypothetical protein